MSTRYSLRQTPKKVAHEGFVETPRTRGPNRRKSQFPEDSADDSSSAPDSMKATKRPSNSRKVSMVEQAASNGRANGKTTSHDAEHNGIIVAGYPDTKQDLKDSTNHTALNGVNGHAAAVKKLDEEQRKIIDGWEVGKDPKIDSSGHFDFGGSLGVSAMMICFPLIMYYMWIGSTFYDGGFPRPTEGQTFVEWVKHMGNLVYEFAFPSLYAWKIYWTFFIVEAAFYCLMPGIYTYGKPLSHEGGKQLKYYCSGMWSWYATILIAGFLHYTRIFPLWTVIDEFGPIMSVAICSGFIVSIGAYISAIYRGAEHRMTGSFFYDFFMGAELNPRMFGILDFKMFFEVRLPWFILFILTSATAARQQENYGYVSAEVWLMLLAHFLYANACAKGEELITTTWDMYYEKWGFMLIFWNLAGVPLSYCHSTLYLANHPPSVYAHSKYFMVPLFIAYLFAYWVWDTTNSQKNRFRSEERGKLVVRKTFPQLPWGTVKNPRIIKTSTGDSILVDGWYGYARKIHYTCDLFFAVSWGLVTGFRSPFPWFYPVFFFGMILHRTWRDGQRCAKKYGASWDEYKEAVPWIFIPYVF